MCLPDLFEIHPYIHKDIQTFSDTFKSLSVLFETLSVDIESLPDFFETLSDMFAMLSSVYLRSFVLNRLLVRS